MAEERNVVEAEVPDRCVDHAVAAESHHGADDCASEDIVPVVILINCEGTADQAGAENGSVEDNELPHGRVVVGKDLELGVEVEVEEDKASKGSRGVARGHGLEAVVDLLLVACANATVEHDLAIAVGNASVRATVDAVIVQAHIQASRDNRLADSEEVGSEACRSRQYGVTV